MSIIAAIALVIGAADLVDLPRQAQATPAPLAAQADVVAAVPPPVPEPPQAPPVAAPTQEAPAPTPPARPRPPLAPRPQRPAGEVAVPDTPPVETSPAGDEEESDRNDDVVRVGSDYAIGVGDVVSGLVVVMGNATIEGHVTGDLVVVLGQARLGPTAVIDGDTVVVGGSLAVREGASAQGDVVVVGGALDAPASFMPGGEQVVFGFRALGDSVRGVLPWVMRGFLWARPIVPSLPWVWAIVAVLFLVYLGVLLVFEHPVRVTAEAMAETPLRALATGLVTLLLAGPVTLLLAASVVGLLVVPFALCAFLIAGLVGKIAAARWLGSRVVGEGDGGRPAFVRSFVVGCVVLVLAYMVPILGGVVWAMAGATGLGAAVLAFTAAYRKESPPMVPPAPPLHPSMPLGDTVSAAFAPEASAVGQVPPPLSAPAAQALALFPKAAFIERLAAFVLDAILVGITIGLLDPLDNDAFVPLFLFYRSAMWAWKGTTVGGIICQLRVVRVDGAPVTAAEALVRGLGSVFSIAVFGLGCLWMLRDAERQTWHDKMAGTCVVKVPRHYPL